jgi:hypothetical protein
VCVRGRRGTPRDSIHTRFLIALGGQVFENADSHTMWIGIGGDHSISELNSIVENVLLAHPPPELESWSQHVISLLAGTVPTAEICERLAAGWAVTFTGFSLGGAIAAHLTVRI